MPGSVSISYLSERFSGHVQPPSGLIDDRSMCPTVNDCTLMVVACHWNGDGQKPIVTTTAQKDRKKINHLKSAIDWNQKRVATGCGEYRQLFVRRDLLDKVADKSNIKIHFCQFFFFNPSLISKVT